jgi:hypothetical protein
MALIRMLCVTLADYMSDEKYIVRSGDTKIAGLREVGHTATPLGHKYVIFSDKPIKGANTEAAFSIVRHFFGDKQSYKKWCKDKNLYTLTWPINNNQNQSSAQINYLRIAEYIRSNGRFNPSVFNLPDLECYWLDKSVDVSINFHKFDAGSNQALTIADGTPAQQFGEKYPIKPKMDREGHFFTTFQPQLISRIIQNRTTLIENSDTALHYNWVLDLRALINDSISLLEITLNQIYIKAQFDPLPQWSFDKNIVGEKHGRRLIDKLKWVRQISGNNLNIETEKNSLDSLRELRNHFNHFDPPSLVVTLEEATTWLNQIIDIGFILIKIRKTMNLPLSTLLINYILQKEAIFNPEPAFIDRLPLDSRQSGYLSSTWTES